MLLNKKPFLRVQIFNNLLYAIIPDNQSFSATLEDVKDLHLKLGHTSLPRIKKYLIESVPSSMKRSFNCKNCDRSKITKSQFKEISTKANKIMQRIHADLIGPISPMAKGGYQYSLTLVDSHSGYISCIPMKSKRNAPHIIKFILLNKFNRLHYFPTEFCSNGGGEFINKELTKFFEEKGIQRIVSEPYHPQHNGKAEQANRTIAKSFRATHLSSRIPKDYWHERIQSCALALNQIPNADGLAPWETMHGTSLPTGYLKPIGTEHTYLDLGNHSRRKFDKKGVHGKLLGYAPKLLSY